MTEQEKELLKDLQKNFRRGDKLIYEILKNEKLGQSIDKELIELQAIHQSLKQVTDIILLEEIVGKSREDEIKKVVTEYIQLLKIPTTVKGYEYLLTAIVLVIQDKKLLKNITKKLYSEIAKIYNKIPSSIEGGIRHAIEISFPYVDNETKNRIFGCRESSCKRRPTNTEYIALVTNYIESMLE